MDIELAITELAKHRSNPGSWHEQDGRGGPSIHCVCGGWELYYDYKNPPDTDKSARTYLNREFARHQLEMLQVVGVFGIQTPPQTLDCFKLVKDGHDWDYSTSLLDMEDWRKKILREDPDTVVKFVAVTRAELEHWKEYGI